MFRIFGLLSLMLWALSASGQRVLRQFVKSNTAAIATIHPDSTDFSDLEPIGKAIGNARIVMLGEQSHGDGATFLAKARLVKYLHEEKGFNVLAFESDFFALNHGWDQLEKEKETISDFLPRNIFTIWTAAEQLKDFFYSYVPATYNTASPLVITGFDNQLHGRYSHTSIKNYLDDYLKKNNVPFRLSEQYVREFVPFLDSLLALKSGARESHLKKLAEMTDIMLTQLKDKGDNDFGIMLLKNLRAYSREFDDLGYKGYMVRDAQMAKNLNWLAEAKFPGEKIIVWAANAHVMKIPFSLPDGEKRVEITPMGAFFTADKRNKQQTYVIGFTSKKGSYGILGRDIRDVNRPYWKSFERTIRKKYAFAFTDFKLFNTRNPAFSKPFSMQGRGHRNTGLAWNRAFDGVFYIREMFPSSYNKDIRKRLGNDSINWAILGVAIKETKSLKKKRVRLTANIRFEGDKKSKAFLRIGINERVAAYKEIGPGDWREYEITSAVGRKPEEIRFNVTASGEGSTLFIDNVTWYVQKNKQWQALTPINDFEAVQTGEIPKGWYVNGKKYKIGATEEAAFSGAKSIRIKIPASN